MLTIDEIRRNNLKTLVAQCGGITNLNRKLGRLEIDSTLNQIANAAPDSKTRNPKGMGSRMARTIETSLGLPRGYMDNTQDSTWPFQKIAKERLEKLSAHQLQVVEETLQRLLEAILGIEDDSPTKKNAA